FQRPSAGQRLSQQGGEGLQGQQLGREDAFQPRQWAVALVPDLDAGAGGGVEPDLQLIQGVVLQIQGQLQLLAHFGVGLLQLQAGLAQAAYFLALGITEEQRLASGAADDGRAYGQAQW